MRNRPIGPHSLSAGLLMQPHTTEPLAGASKPDVVRARFFLVVLCLGWGMTWPMMSIALREIPPFSMRVASLFLGAATLISLAFLQGRSLRIPSLQTLGHLVAASSFNIVAFSIFTPFAQLHADTSRVAIVVYTMPIWATLLALPILGERLTTMRAVALALCIAGMAVLIYPLMALGVPTGILLAIGAAVSWGAGTVYLKWARLDGDPMAVAVWQIVIGFLVLGAVLPVVEGSLQLGQAHQAAILALIFAGVIGSGISNFLWFDIVRRLPATTASLGILSSPLIGVISSMLLLGERPTLADIIGFALMFAASACVLLRPQDAAR
jgi:drug/metabolite transporter (DMT)-like permease